MHFLFYYSCVYKACSCTHRYHGKYAVRRQFCIIHPSFHLYVDSRCWTQVLGLCSKYFTCWAISAPPHFLNASKNQENILFSSAIGTSNSTISSFWWLLVFPMGIHDNWGIYIFSVPWDDPEEGIFCIHPYHTSYPKRGGDPVMCFKSILLFQQKKKDKNQFCGFDRGSQKSIFSLSWNTLLWLLNNIKLSILYEECKRVMTEHEASTQRCLRLDLD